MGVLVRDHGVSSFKMFMAFRAALWPESGSTPHSWSFAARILFPGCGVIALELWLAKALSTGSWNVDWFSPQILRGVQPEKWPK